jgi:hypothetical protein
MPTKLATVEEYLASLTSEQREVVDVLRAMALNAGAGVTEHIKWNAPSFCVNGDDRITLGSDTKGQIRVILHRGVKPKDSVGFHFNAPADLVKWAAADRGVITLRSTAHLRERELEVGDIFRRWVEVTA